MSPSLLLALTVFSATVNVDDYLDVNETYQNAAVQRAIDAAGVDGEVLFTGGSTYTLRQEIWQHPGQTWRSVGTGLATIRRADEVTTTLLEDAATGSTSIRVADPTLFPIGSGISPVVGPGGIRDGEDSFIRVAPSETDTIELRKPLRNDYLAGDTVVSTTRMINMARDGVLDTLRIDGNAAANDTFLAWSVHEDVIIGSNANNATIRNLELLNAQGNSIIITGNDARVENSLIQGGNLAAVHIGTADGLEWINNRVVGTSLQNLRGGHTEGAFTVSLYNYGITIKGGSFEDLPIAAIGGAQPGVNSDFLVEGVTFLNNAAVWSSLASASKNGYLGLTMIGNSFINSGDIRLDGNLNEFIESVLLTDNSFQNTDLFMEYVLDAQLFRNEFDEDSGQIILSTTFGRFSPADLNNDGDIDTADLTRFFQNFTGDIGESGGKTFLDGDTDGDGDVDTADLTLAFQKFTGDLGGEPQPYSPMQSPGPSTTPTPTPEPGGLFLAVCGVVVVLVAIARKKLYAHLA